MELPSPEEKARLARKAEFIAAVNRGIASADRGDLAEHDEVVERIDRLLQSWQCNQEL